jgi:hypothetical protein
MKRSKVIFVNKSKFNLHVQYKKYGSPDTEDFLVLNRKVLRLFPEQYEITVYYEGHRVLISSKMTDSMDITAVSAPDHSKFSAKQIVLSLSERNVKIIFRDQISVGSILDGSARTRF